MRTEEFYRKRNHSTSDRSSVDSSDLRFAKPQQQRPSGSYFSQYLPIFRDKAMSTTASNYAVEMPDATRDVDEESLLHTSANTFHNLPDSTTSDNRNILSQNSNTVISFRRIQPKDRMQIQALHEEWFPVEYQQEFYDDLCSHQRMCHSGHALYTVVAVIPKQKRNHNRTSSMDNNETDTSDEQIIACLVGCVLSAHKLNDNSRQMLVPAWPHRHSRLFYIMTLGTVTKYRHLGLATQLVQQVMETVVSRDQEMGTVYLHVITMNEAAIRFYEDKLRFWKVQEIPDYYTIDGEPYNCYLYARYFHGNRGHLGFFNVVSQWISSLWSSFSYYYFIKSRGFYHPGVRTE
jgi:ribosomal protein S18 acetylase RimI-like enzyme